MSQPPKRILLLDDDYESMAPLKLFLEAVHGFEVTLTAAATLIDQLPGECFDLICLDLMIHPISLDANHQEVANLHFPGVNWQKTGLAFLERLRAGKFLTPPPTVSIVEQVPSSTNQQMRHTNGYLPQPIAASRGTSPQVPVILLSAVADRSREERILRNDERTVYLEKPFDLEQLLALIERFTGGTVSVSA